MHSATTPSLLKFDAQCNSTVDRRSSVDALQKDDGPERSVAGDFARALTSNPTLLILDEPSTGLAPTIVESICQTLSDLRRQGTMILLVEQNAPIALDLASRAYVLEQGSIVADGPAATLRQDARVMSAYLG